MITRFQRNSNQSLGFTLFEVVIAIAISAIIILGMTSFLMRLNQNISSSLVRWKSYIELSRFNEAITAYRRTLPNSIIINSGGWYDAVILTNSGRTTGVLLGVVKLNWEIKSDALIDPISNYSVYGKKVPAFTELTPLQIANIETFWIGSALSIPFGPEKQFSLLNLSTFSLRWFNNSNIVQINMTITDGYFSNLAGLLTDSIPLGDPLSVTLYF